MACEKELLLRCINTHSFAANDLTLFLDTHPKCEDALAELKKHLCARQEAIEIYEKKYGPLTVDGLNGACAYSWISNPWPWEKEV